MRWQGSLGILMNDLFKFWHQWWQVFAWLNIGGSTHGLQGAFLFCEAGKMTYDSLILQLNNNLRCDGSGKKPWISGFFRCGPGPIGFLTPRLMLVLIITHLVQLVKRLNVVDQNVSTFCKTAQTYNGAFQWTCTPWWKTNVETR